MARPPSTGLQDGLQNLNEVVGQGICFRGQLLVAVSMEVLEGRTQPEPPQAPQGSRLSQLTGKKKKKARHGQIPTGIQQHRDASSSVDAPEIPSAVEVEVEELLPLPEVGLKFSKGSGYTLSALECVPGSQALNTRAGGCLNMVTWVKTAECVHMCSYVYYTHGKRRVTAQR